MKNYKIVYIHGIGNQEPTFYENFHQRLENRLRIKSNSNITIEPIPIFWFDRVEPIMEGYENNARTAVREHMRFIALGILASIMILIGYAYFVDLIDMEFPLSILEMFLSFVVILGIILMIFGRIISAYMASRFVDPLAVEIFWYARSRNYYDPDTQTLSRVDIEGEKNVFDLFSYLINKELEGVNDEVIFVAHSLGAVIAFDYLFNMGYIFDPNAEERKSGSFQLASFVSMGTQIPIFTSAMGYYNSSAVLGSTPYNLDTSVSWVNLVDLDDPLGRKCEDFFPAASNNGQLRDIDVETNLSFSSHIAYWNPSWWRRLKNSLLIRNDDPVEIIANHIANLT